MAFVELVALPDASAQVVAGALRAEGLRVDVRRNVLGAVYGLTTGTFATRVFVHPDDLAAARALLAEVEAGEP